MIQPLNRALYGMSLLTCLVIMGCSSSDGGGGGSSLSIKYKGSTQKATIDQASAEDAAKLLIDSMPQCSTTTSSPTALSIRMLGAAGRNVSWFGPYGLTGSAPMDQSGPCGGTLSYTNYSHSSGVTKGTISLIDYCSYSADNTPVTTNGDIPFVDNGKPSDMGPVRQSATANCPEYEMATETGKDIKGGFAGLRFTPAEPGVSPTDDAPNTVVINESIVEEVGTGVQMKADDMRFTAGATQHTVTGTACSSEIGCIDISTDPSNPITYEPITQTFSGGTVILEGSAGTSVQLDIIPGTTLGVEVVAINEEPVAPGSIEVACSVP